MSYDEDSDAKDVGSTSRGPFPLYLFCHLRGNRSPQGCGEHRGLELVIIEAIRVEPDPEWIWRRDRRDAGFGHPYQALADAS